MEDVWLSVEDDSSNSSFADSDIIDSETEAELYSVIHYEQNLHELKCPTTKSENFQTLDQIKNVYTEKNENFAKNQFVCNSNSVSENNVNNIVTQIPETLIPKELSPKLNLDKRKNSYNHDKCNVSFPQNSSHIDINHNVKDTLMNDNNKRKTDDCSAQSSSLVEKRKTDDCSAQSSSSSLVYKNCTEENDSSDSDDSIIWREEVAKKFLTNLNEDDIICISSDSESESQFNCLQTSKRSEKNLANMSMPNIKIGENVKDLWFINDRDLHKPKNSYSRRYHDNVENTCTNCSEKGHNARFCPLPKSIKCYICGNSGHTGSACANRICGRCFSTGHDTRRCWIPYVGYCSLCTMKGHIQENCPDIWRRYHLTINPGKVIRRGRCNNSTFTYCWNCGEGGHCGAVCTEYRGYKRCLPIWPCVVSYDNPENLLKNRIRSLNLSDRPGNSMRSQLNQINFAAGGNFPVPKGKKKKNNKKKKKKCQQPNIEKGNVGNVGHCPPEQRRDNTLDPDRLVQKYTNFLKAIREKDFPRTPKNNQPAISDDTVPEAVNIMLKKRQKRREKKRYRKAKAMQNLAMQNSNETIARLNNAIKRKLFRNRLKKTT